jgi:hypothetical protein
MACFHIIIFSQSIVLIDTGVLFVEVIPPTNVSLPLRIMSLIAKYTGGFAEAGA